MPFLLVHSAGTGPWVWEGWDGERVDLHAGLNVAEASLLNYEAVVTARALLLPRPLCVVGHGLGGIVAILAARRVEPERLVLLDPGHVEEPPARVATRPDAPLALAEARRPVDVPPLPPTLHVYGDAEPAWRLGADELHLPGESHWDLVLGKKARAAAVEWVR